VAESAVSSLIELICLGEHVLESLAHAWQNLLLYVIPHRTFFRQARVREPGACVAESAVSSLIELFLGEHVLESLAHAWQNLLCHPS
jgi:hypothetical protein